jgi:hypothetical protein
MYTGYLSNVSYSTARLLRSNEPLLAAIKDVFGIMRQSALCCGSGLPEADARIKSSEWLVWRAYRAHWRHRSTAGFWQNRWLGRPGSTICNRFVPAAHVAVRSKPSPRSDPALEPPADNGTSDNEDVGVARTLAIVEFLIPSGGGLNRIGTHLRCRGHTYVRRMRGLNTGLGPS